MTSCTARTRGPSEHGKGFTLVELMVASTLALLLLAATLGTNLQLIKSGLQLSRHQEMESQVRRSIEQFGNDVRNATDLTLNSSSDLTLTIAASDGTTSQVTYAWTAASQAFFRVPGASSGSNKGRLYLATGIPPLADGSAGLSFARFTRDNTAAASDLQTKSIQLRMTLCRNTPATFPPVSFASAATFVLRNKAVQ